MTDQLYLSIWLDRQGRGSRVKQFLKLLRVFPFSQREQPQSLIAVQAISETEPPLLERPLNGPLDLPELELAIRDYSGDDIAYRVDSWWDLWTYTDDWSLTPNRVSLYCFGPEFDNGTERSAAEQEDLRIDFGVDSAYLPQPEIQGSGKLIESNIRSVLRVVHELDNTLDVEKRRLETESGENFADRLEVVLRGESRVQ